MKPRPMRKYTPRKRRSNRDLQKQRIEDFEHLLSMDLGSFLILCDEGSDKQKEQAAEKLKRDFRKYSGDLEAVARDLGEEFAGSVEKYTRVFKRILETTDSKIDPASINEYRTCSKQIRKLLAA